MKILLILVLLLIVLLEYSLCVVSHDADEKAERDYLKWKERKGADDERSNSKADE